MNEINVGLVGAGLWGEMHAKVYSNDPRIKFKAICDKDENKAKALQSKYDIENVYSSHKDMFKNEDLYSVSVVTPDFSHKDIVVDALRSDMHVIVEKPMATTIDDAKEMITAAKEKNKILFTDFHNRWNPLFVNSYNAINNGDLGEVKYIYIRHSNSLFVPLEMLSWSGKSSVAWFLASHNIDLIRWLFQDNVKRVYSVSRSGILESKGITSQDFFASTLELSNGGVAVVENAWILPQNPSRLGDFKCEIIGSEGNINIDFNQRGIEKITKDRILAPDILVALDIHGKDLGFAYESIKHFLDCIIDGKEPLVKPEDGLEVTKTISGIYKSIDSKQPVDI